MNRLIKIHDSFFDWVEAKVAPWLLPTLARFTFAATLLIYFWGSAQTKLGDGLFGLFMPTAGAYAQIFPRAMEAVVYDVSQLGLIHWAVVVAGTVAELALPLLIVLGLMTRLSAVAMIGFVVVQSLTDLYGHGGIADPATVGAWFDGIADAKILDQRLYWLLLLLIIAVLGAGPVAFDRVLRRRQAVSG